MKVKRKLDLVNGIIDLEVQVIFASVFSIVFFMLYMMSVDKHGIIYGGILLIYSLTCYSFAIRDAERLRILNNKFNGV